MGQGVEAAIHGWKASRCILTCFSTGSLHGVVSVFPSSGVGSDSSEVLGGGREVLLEALGACVYTSIPMYALGHLLVRDVHSSGGFNCT